MLCTKSSWSMSRWAAALVLTLFLQWTRWANVKAGVHFVEWSVILLGEVFPLPKQPTKPTASEEHLPSWWAHQQATLGATEILHTHWYIGISFILYYTIYDVIWYDIIWYYMKWYYIILYYIILDYVILYYVMLCYVTLCYVMLYYVIIYIYTHILYCIYVHIIRTYISTQSKYQRTSKQLQSFEHVWLDREKLSSFALQQTLEDQ